MKASDVILSIFAAPIFLLIFPFWFIGAIALAVYHPGVK